MIQPAHRQLGYHGDNSDILLNRQGGVWAGLGSGTGAHMNLPIFYAPRGDLVAMCCRLFLQGSSPPPIFDSLHHLCSYCFFFIHLPQYVWLIVKAMQCIEKLLHVVGTFKDSRHSLHTTSHKMTSHPFFFRGTKHMWMCLLHHLDSGFKVFN